MKKTTRKITITAILTAFAVIFLYLASVLPTGQIGFLGAASLFGIAATVECGFAGGAAVYVCASVLGFILVPNKKIALVFILFFGYYPLLKAAAEKCRSRIVEWIIKLAVMNAALAVIFFVVSYAVFDLSKIGNSYPLAFIVCSAIFVFFDIGVTYLTSFYIKNISRRIRRN